MTRLVARLASRAAVRVGGPDWRPFLQGLLTQDVEGLRPGELRFGALLAPQGRLLFDLFILGRDDGCVLDTSAERRDALIQRLSIYRLRAKVEIALDDTAIWALWGGRPPARDEEWRQDPRLPALGWRAHGETRTGDAEPLGESAYDAFRLGLGVPDAPDFAYDETYPIEADFDLLHGIDFAKGCFVGQETTSRMKRRGAIKSRMAPVVVEGETPASGDELLAGELRAGRALSSAGGRTMALLRLDRLEAGPLRLADGRPWRPLIPKWWEAA